MTLVKRVRDTQELSVLIFCLRRSAPAERYPTTTAVVRI
jgi:hypothetical protein